MEAVSLGLGLVAIMVPRLLAVSQFPAVHLGVVVIGLAFAFAR